MTEADADAGDAVASAAPAAAPRSLIALLAGASALGPISSLMLMPALPAIRAEFGAATAATQAVISVFLFVFAIGIPLAGPLSDRHGRRPLLLGEPPIREYVTEHRARHRGGRRAAERLHRARQ
ncbi:MAG: MFS transporter, partial [Planctomycetia bacterium]